MKAFILLSGGIDSMACVNFYKALNCEVECIFCGGMLINIWMWSGHACASMISTLFCWHNFRISAQTPHGIDIANWYVLNYLHLLLS